MLGISTAEMAQNFHWDFPELISALVQASTYHLVFEALLVIWIVRLLFMRSYKPAQRIELTSAEKEQLIQDWKPEPLVPADWQPDDAKLAAFGRCANSALTKRVTFDGCDCLNLATLNMLDFAADPALKQCALEAMRIYGVGSCGPRGFYGTMDVHLKLEEQLAAFFGCEEAVVYSYGFCTIATAIPAYSKREDVIFVDEGVCFAVQKGLEASRSRIRWFKHNDLADLERLLLVQAEEDKRDPKRAKQCRRFMVVEGLYINHGDLCPLPELVRLKYKYKVRLFLEESVSFGTLGATGRGVTEHFGVRTADVDLIAASLENAVGGCGGFCVGSKFVMDHQRLSGLGYSFSASQPPMLAAAASKALSLMEDGARSRQLQALARASAQLLSTELAGVWQVHGDAVSPVKHLQLLPAALNTAPALEAVCDAARLSGLLLTPARYLELSEHKTPEPSLRVCLNCAITSEEMREAVAVLRRVGERVVAAIRAAN